MRTNLSNRTTQIVASSLPLMESARDRMTAAMSGQVSLQAPDPSDARHQAAVDAIMDMLIDHVRQIGHGGNLPRIEEHAQRHRNLAISSEHYSAFGEALHSGMKDIFGAQASPAVLGAWGDTYWAVARMMPAMAAEMPLAA